MYIFNQFLHTWLQPNWNSAAPIVRCAMYNHNAVSAKIEGTCMFDIFHESISNLFTKKSSPIISKSHGDGQTSALTHSASSESQLFALTVFQMTASCRLKSSTLILPTGSSPLRSSRSSSTPLMASKTSELELCSFIYLFLDAQQSFFPTKQREKKALLIFKGQYVGHSSILHSVSNVADRINVCLFVYGGILLPAMLSP